MEEFPKKELIKFPDIASEIEKMVEIDQDMRERSLENTEVWNENIDERNTERMKEIIKEIGWPTVSKVGKEGAHNAWLLVQHADHDVDFQKECLELMKEESETEVSRKDIAYLEDRICVNEDCPQIYGTQFTQKGGGFVPRMIENIENLDERRKGVGLDTLEESIRQMEEKYKKE